MNNYRLTVSYDGTRYLGWQRLGDPEKNARTIQGKLEAVLARLAGQNVEVHGSGRTDAGVHAAGQVASFRAPIDLPPEELRAYLNRYLPEDIAVISAERAEERFHARLHARGKLYRYRIRNSDMPDVFSQRFEYLVREPLDADRMRRGADYLCGEHDFRPFCSSKRTKKSTVRTIYDITVVRDGPLVTVDYHGNGFLYNMARILTGTLIEIGRGDRPPEDIGAVFAGTAAAGYTAPAKGLTLLRVDY